MHTDCIKKALGISGMATEVSSWRKVADDKQRGGQIDLVIKRADRIVHLCEMKFSKSEYRITDAYEQNAGIANLLLAPYFKQIADEYQQALRDVVAYAVQNGIPVPTFSAAVAYYDSYRAAVLPANLIQAQRDYFGAHTYKRTDKEGVFHTEWLD